ncbi:hypothetical protein [Cloacibacterium sp.]|uniref:hypothetical protein n=1 Tax=Cloacibacterium sp. TaxID=1913682 RepID=UPI0039E567DE
MAKQLKPHFDKICLNGNWNFDLDDCDRILRLVVTEEQKDKIVSVKINECSLSRTTIKNFITIKIKENGTTSFSYGFNHFSINEDKDKGYLRKSSYSLINS